MKTLSRDNLIYFLEPDARPAITIDSGEELMVETWDAFEGVRDPELLTAKALRAARCLEICSCIAPILYSHCLKFFSAFTALELAFSEPIASGGAAHNIVNSDCLMTKVVGQFGVKVPWLGLEPRASHLAGERSIHLSYQGTLPTAPWFVLSGRATPLAIGLSKRQIVYIVHWWAPAS